jgi:hypothetical protein
MSSLLLTYGVFLFIYFFKESRFCDEPWRVLHFLTLLFLCILVAGYKFWWPILSINKPFILWLTELCGVIFVTHLRVNVFCGHVFYSHSNSSRV